MSRLRWGAFAALVAVSLTALPAAPTPAVAADSGDGAWSGTKTLTRTFARADGTVDEVSRHTVTVKADQTRDLRGRQRISVSWSGAQPSGARASNPYGENGLQQEYPVVVLQCRGRDVATAPASQRLTPSSCWTSSVAQRSQVQTSAGAAVWTQDSHASAADRQRLSGMTPFPSAKTCPTADTTGYATALTPFRSARGTTFAACDSSAMPPEAAVGAAFPPAEVAAFTDADGRGQVRFEVRSDVENESLGCSDTVPCSVVVVPIAGISCDTPSTPATTVDRACRQSGNFAAGSSNFAGDGVDLAVSPALWWSASNWRNRFSIPISFGLPPDTCDVLDPRAPTGFYGTELLAQAALQWAPAYCLSRKRFKFQLNQMSDAAGFAVMTKADGAAAVVSSAHDSAGTAVGYAPTAVTGFAISFVIDRPGNAGELTRLRLTPRLVAKLLTQSYLGSDLGRAHPGMARNPLSINVDPEFTRLNPGLSTTAQEAAATVLSLSESNDVIEALTSWIAQDPDAAGFVAGKPDPWGATVNPAYARITLPVAEWPLRDSFVPSTSSTCRKRNPAVYFTQIAAPVTTLRKISDALLDSWPNVQTRCDVDVATGLDKLGRIDRQNYGSRFMLGVVSLGDAARYGLRSADLQTRPGSFVGPTDAALGRSVALMTQRTRLGAFTLDQADVRKAGNAYPGTTVLYTAARLDGLPKADAAKVASFVRIATTEGQRPGSGNGRLPAGYLPLTRTGATSQLFASAQRVATAIAAQKGPSSAAGSTDDDTQDGSKAGTAPAGGGGGAAGAAGADAAAPPGAAVPTAPAAAVTPRTTNAAATSPTQALTSALGRLLLPALLGIGIVGGLAVAASRLRGRIRP